jgi:hypothetical protein
MTGVRPLLFVLNHCITFLALLVNTCMPVPPAAISVLEAFPNNSVVLSSSAPVTGAVVGGGGMAERFNLV